MRVKGQTFIAILTDGERHIGKRAVTEEEFKCLVQATMEEFCGELYWIKETK